MKITLNKVIDANECSIMTEINCTNVYELKEVNSLANIINNNPEIKVEYNQNGVFLIGSWTISNICIMNLLIASLESFCVNRINNADISVVNHESNV